MLDWLKGGPPRLYIEHSPDIIESSSNISLTCYSSERKEAVVPCRFHWYRSKNGVTTEIVNAKGSTYMCQPSDVGAVIKVEVESNDPAHPAVSSLQFGPIRMDVLLKKNIERVLQQGLGDFHVRLLSADGRDKEITLRITEASLALIDHHGRVLLELGYTISSPILEINLKDSSRILVEVPEQLLHPYSALMSELGLSIKPAEPDRLELKFSSRINRDVFLFCQKAFAAKKQLAVAHVLNHIESSTQTGDSFNYLLEIESLRFDLYRMILANGKLSEERDSYQAEAARLQQQLNELTSEMILSAQKGGSGSTLRSTPNGAIQTPGFMEAPIPIPPVQIQPFQMEALIYPSLAPPVLPDPIKHRIEQPVAENLNHIFSLNGLPAEKQRMIEQQASNNFLHMFGSPASSVQRVEVPQLNPPQRQEMDKKVVEMASVLLPPPLEPELTLEQRQRMDIVALQDYSHKAYQQIKKLRAHIDKLSAEVAWFYSQHGQPTLPLKLRYRISQEVDPIKEESSMFEKSRTLLDAEPLRVHTKVEESSWKSKEIGRLTATVNKLREENESLTEKNKHQGYRVSYLQDACKKREEESRLALNKIIELNGVIKGLEDFLGKLQNPTPNKVTFLYDGRTQKNVPFRAHDYTINAGELIRELQSLKARNTELVREKGELTKLRNMAQADNLLLQIEKGKLDEKIKSLEDRLQEADKELVAFMKKATTVENKLADIISENTRLQSRRDEQLAARSAQAVHQKEEEIARLYLTIMDKEKRLQELDLQLHTLTDENQALLKWQTKHRKRQQELQEENRMLRRGQDALNRSRQLNSQLDSFHAEENQLLRQQYELLKEEHDKLTHMCDRYHSEAKESLKLRQEILRLKEQQMRQQREPETAAGLPTSL